MKRILTVMSTVLLAGALFLDTPATDTAVLFPGSPVWQLEEIDGSARAGNITGFNAVPVRSENSYIVCKWSPGGRVPFVMLIEDGDGPTVTGKGSGAGAGCILKAVLAGTTQ
jgi:hypothetical protein